jgi:cell volume regulation protein A
VSNHLDVALLVGAAVVLVGALAVRLGLRLGVPGLLLFLGLGMLLGDAGLGVNFDDAALTRDLGLAGLVIILAEGGLTTRLSAIRPVLGASAVLATVGVVASVGVVALAAHTFIDLDWPTSVLLGAVVSSTDAAAVFSVLRTLSLRPRIKSILEAESGINDAPAIVIVSLVVSGSWGSPWYQAAGLMLYELAAGAAIGLLVGYAGQWLLPRLALPAAGLYPLASLALIVVGYSAATIAHASGFLAVYTCAVLLGSSKLPHRRTVIGFAEGLAWLAQIGLFVLLGLLVSPQDLPAAVLPGLAVGAVLTFVARPLSVWLTTTWFGVRWLEQVFLSAAGLRGAVPIVFATIPLAAGVKGADEVFNVTFVLVLVFTAIQAPSLPWFARRTGVLTLPEAGELTVDAAPLDELNAMLLDVAVPTPSRLAGEYISDLRLPVGAMVSLVVREGRSLVPDRTTRVRAGDRLLVVTTSQVREEAERRLRAVSRRGSLAGWYGERGSAE